MVMRVFGAYPIRLRAGILIIKVDQIDPRHPALAQNAANAVAANALWKPRCGRLKPPGYAVCDRVLGFKASRPSRRGGRQGANRQGAYLRHRIDVLRGLAFGSLEPVERSRQPSMAAACVPAQTAAATNKRAGASISSENSDRQSTARTTGRLLPGALYGGPRVASISSTQRAAGDQAVEQSRVFGGTERHAPHPKSDPPHHD